MDYIFQDLFVPNMRQAIGGSNSTSLMSKGRAKRDSPPLTLRE
jgi:hypothetical protein